MTLKNISVIAAAALLALTSCAGGKTGFPKIDQKGKTAIVAHRGFWNCEAAGFAENSIASLKAAQDNGFWGSEFDVHITTDDVILVFHNDEIDGARIDTCEAAVFAGHRLANGEKVPTLDEYLTQGEKSDKTVLVLELKPKKKAKKSKTGLELANRDVYLSFDQQTGFINQYLEGDFSPEELAEFGINGFDYNSKAVLKDSTIVDRAHALGMSTNVWTVNKPEKMRKFIDLGIDAITTNEPLVLRDLLGEKEFKK